MKDLNLQQMLQWTRSSRLIRRRDKRSKKVPFGLNYLMSHETKTLPREPEDRYIHMYISSGYTYSIRAVICMCREPERKNQGFLSAGRERVEQREKASCEDNMMREREREEEGFCVCVYVSCMQMQLCTWQRVQARSQGRVGKQTLRVVARKRIVKWSAYVKPGPTAPRHSGIASASAPFFFNDSYVVC